MGEWTVRKEKRTWKVLLSMLLIAAILLSGQKQIVFAEDEVISEWSWISKENEIQWSEPDQRYEMELTEISEENPLTDESLGEILPSEILTVLGGEEKKIPIEWDLEKTEEGLTSGEIVLTAALQGEGYVLSPEAKSLELLVRLAAQKKQTEQENQAEQENQIEPYHSGAGTGVTYGAYAHHILDTAVNPSGTTINLFDYWLYDSESQRFDPDDSSSSDGFNEINQGLKFNYGAQWKGNHNLASSSSYVNAGIVENLLGYQGLPVLNSAYNVGAAEGTELSMFLPMIAHFDPSLDQPGKKSFTNVQDLLQIDEEGYYYYDSKKNFAEFNENTNSFNLYDSPGVVTSAYGGQFFPFNQAGEVFKEVNGNLTNSDSLWATAPQQSQLIHHYLGLTMRTMFAQLDGGTNNGKDVTYSFSGDDDVWVFIDGVLVGDVGGMHAPTNLEINFRTGSIHVWGDIRSDREPTNTWTTLKACFEEAGRYDESMFNGDTFADGTSHTLSFFYLERGNAASNLSLKYNLATEPDNTVTKTDEDGNAVAGIEYELYTADSNYNPGEVVFTGTTDEDGRLALEKNTKENWTLKELYDKSQYYVLKEKNVPEGRRTSDIHLKFAGDASAPYWVVDNSWDSGADIEIKQNLKVKITEANYNSYIERGYAVAAFVLNEDSDKLVYQDESGNWKETERTYSSSSYLALKEAHNADPTILNMSGEGLFEGFRAMPLDFDRHPDRYTIVYQYVKNGLFTTLKEETEQRTFTSNIKAVNPRNILIAEKVDEDGGVLPGVEFALYQADSVTVANGTATVQDGAAAYDTGTTDAGGQIVFGLEGTSDEKKPLVSGETYYLREETGPEGYVKNEELVEIRVDNTGVYASAGTAGDGIKVRTELSGVLPTMKAYAVVDPFDASIHEIKAVLETTDDFGTGWTAAGTEQHYLYGETGYELLETPQPGTAETDVGWSRMNIRQCREHDPQEESLVKQELGEKDLSGAFFKRTVVQVTNRKVPTLTVEKRVVGEGTDGPFTFTLEVTGATADQTFTGTYSGTDGRTVTVKNGGEFTLTDGQSITFSLLPKLAYQISETEGEAYSTRYFYGENLSQEGDGNVYENSSGLEAGETDHVLFENSYVQEADFSFYKTGGEGQPLEGAKFVLYEYTGTGNLDGERIPVDKNGDLEADYENANQWTVHPSGKQTSGSNGMVSFTKLKSTSVYRLIEYEAPDNYITPEGQWILRYDSGEKQFKITGSVGNPPAFEDIQGTVPYRMKNYRLAGLPLTGGRGIVAIMAAGILVMAAGSFAMIRKHRQPANKRKGEKEK